MSAVPLLSSLSNQVRLDIVRLLHSEGALSVGEVASKIGQSQPIISRHLIILRDAGAVTAEAKGPSRIYRVERAVVRLVTEAEEIVKN
ncbi:Bacterial regulatory protein, arsR family [compost metagenome]